MKWLWDNIYLTREERNRYFFLVFVLLFLIVLKAYSVFWYQPKLILVDSSQTHNIEYAWVDSAENNSTAEKDNSNKTDKPHSYSQKRKSQQKYTSYTSKKYPKKQKEKAEEAYREPLSFSFDPNTLSKDSLLLLGISKHAVSNLLKYRNKGGRIKNPQDLSKVYGLNEKTLKRITPLVTIAQASKSADVQTARFEKKSKKEPTIIDINTADTTLFQSLYGIGPVYARMIINFRNKLGGFFTIDQVGDTYGIPDSTFLKIKAFLSVEPDAIQKQNINTLGLERLKKHPYINWKEAKSISAYMDMHGKFKSMNDFKKLYGIRKSKLDTLKLYFEAK